MRSTWPWGSPGQASRPPTSGRSETTRTGPPWWPRLASAGVDTAEVEVRREPTAVTLVELRPSGDRVFVEEHFGASGRYRPAPDALARLDSRTWVHGVGLATPEALLELERANVSYDFSDSADQALIDLLAPRLELAFISAAGGDRETALAHAQAAVAAGAKAAVVTRGGEGSLAFNGRVVERPAEPVAVVDTLGAGDALIAAVIAAHVRGADIADRTRSRRPRRGTHLHPPRSLGGGMTTTTRSQELFDRAYQLPARRSRLRHPIAPLGLAAAAGVRAGGIRRVVGG